MSETCMMMHAVKYLEMFTGSEATSAILWPDIKRNVQIDPFRRLLSSFGRSIPVFVHV